MHKVKSTSVSHIGHDGDTLHVTFSGSGKTYAYPGVSQDQFQQLRIAQSIGKHLNASIMPGRTGKLVK
jgi:hypothetical protein